MAHRYIGRNIYELRKKRGWSQSDLARKLDKKASTISSYETDSKTPSVDTIIAMSELFGVSIDELIYGENAEVLSTKHLAAEQKRAVADLLQGLTLYNDGNDKDGLARTRLLFASHKGNGAVKKQASKFLSRAVRGCVRPCFFGQNSSFAAWNP